MMHGAYNVKLIPGCYLSGKCKIWVPIFQTRISKESSTTPDNKRRKNKIFRNYKICNLNSCESH